MLSGTYRHIRHIAAAAMTIAVLNGCVEEIDNDGVLVGKPAEQICFNSSVYAPKTKSQASCSFGYLSVEEGSLSPAAPSTRSAPLTQLDGLEAEVTAYLFDSWSSDIQAWTPLTGKKFIFEEFLLKAEEDPVMWKEAEATAYDKMRVYAVHPYGLEWSVEGDSGEPQITYSTGTDPRTHGEVLTAVAEVDREVWRQEIPLTFHHALTGIRFKAGFSCTIESLTLEGICTKGTLHLGPDGWTSSEEKTFSMDFGTGKAFTAGTLLNDGEDIYMMIPQVLGSNAKLTLRYDSGKELTANMSGVKWEAGKLITYTLHETVQSSSTVYFDIEAGNISITPSSYSGYVYAGGKVQKVSGAHSDEIEYYVYQSSEAQSSTNKDNTGWETTVGIGECRIPQYERVTFEDHTWSDYITDNKVVEDVIENWDNKAGTAGAVRNVGRDSTIHYIHVGGQLKCKLTVDNVYSRYHDSKGVGRTTGGIGFIPTGTGSTLTINMKGDNRFGCIHYSNRESGSGRQIIFTGTGSMTVADADFYMTKATSSSSVIGDFEYGYYSNHWCAAIGNNDSADFAYGIVFESGVVFAGTTKAENCSAIGGGGNGHTSITIKGGDITAVATTTGTAIGGGIGFNSGGGKGEVHISGGNVYAYNFANRWDIPSSAIGGAGSKAKFGSEGKVTITGGNVYAQSSIGTAIGGGSSYTMQGGDAIINISGGNVVAKSVAAESGLTPGKTISGGVGIGGGTGCTSGSGSNQNGGKATVTISGNPIIRTGSIGGGHTNSPGGHLGFATIDISGGDIQAQFIMEPTGSGLADDRPAFVMTGGTIHSSNVNDKEFIHVKSVGGAVYMEDGIFEMSGGHIKNCHALSGVQYISKEQILLHS